MAKNIEPHLQLISEYTRLAWNDHFSIPAYQRGYSWTTENCAKLWEDVWQYAESRDDDPYFFGTVIIDCSRDHTLSLIDGQQRTTTFLLLLKAMMLRIGEVKRDLPDDEDTRVLKKGLNNRYDTIFRILYKADEERQVEIMRDWNRARGTVVLENGSINELYKDDFQAIVDAQTFDEAERSVYRIPRKQKDNKYTNFFRNFKYFYDSLCGLENWQLNKFAKTFLEQCQVIEIRSWQVEQAIMMFNSLNSTGMPLSDADIISAQLYSASDQKEQFVAQWQNITRAADDLARAKVMTIDSVLQQYMYMERARSAEYKLSEVTTPGVRKYYTIIRKDLLGRPQELCDAFEKILALWTKAADFPLVRLMLKFNENFKLFLLPYLYRFEADELTEERLRPVAESLLRLFTLIEACQRGFSASIFKTFLFNENLKVVDAGYGDAQIIADFDRHIREGWKEAEVKDYLRDYDKNVLVYLNEYLYARRAHRPFRFDGGVNVEHVMPASGHNVEVIRADAGIEDRQEFDALVNQLGNKILLEESINKSISNDWFVTKKGKTVQSRQGYRNSAFGLATELADYPSDRWRRADIEAYTEKAVERIAAFIFHRDEE